MGERIVIDATDNVAVQAVAVVLRSQSGAVVEEGPAQRNLKPRKWTYVATVDVPASETGVTVEVTAVDLPGNKTVARVDRLLQRGS